MQNKGKEEKKLHWAEEQEIIKSNAPLVFLLKLMKKTPKFFIHFIVFPVSFFFYVFSRRAREEAILYQEQLKKYTNGRCPKRINAYKQIFAWQNLCDIFIKFHIITNINSTCLCFSAWRELEDISITLH